MKRPKELGHGHKRNKGFLRLEEDSGKGRVVVRVAQSSGVAQLGAEIAWKEKEVGQRSSLGFAIGGVEGICQEPGYGPSLACGSREVGSRGIQEARILARSQDIEVTMDSPQQDGEATG